MTIQPRRRFMLARIGLALAAGALSLPLAAAVGSWSTTGPYGGTVYALSVYEAAPNTLYVASRGGIFRTVNNGATWQRIEIGLPQTMYAGYLVAATTTPVLYVASMSRVYRSGNAGDLWVPVSALPADTYIRHVALRRGTTNDLAIATNRGILVSNNGGSTWSGAAASIADVEFSRVAYATDGTLYAVVAYPDPGILGGAVVMRSTDAGVTWNPTPAQPATFGQASVLTSSPANPLHLAAGGGFSDLEFSTDGGATWAPRALPASGAGCGQVLAYTPHPTNALGGFLACRDNGVHSTTNLGVASPAWTTWTPANGLSANGTDPVQANVIAVHPAFASTAHLWLGASDGGLFRSTNGGTTWAAINVGFESVNIRALAAHPVDTGPGAIVLAGQGDTASTTRAILKSPDGGTTWETANSGLNAEQVRSLAIDPTTVDANPLTTEAFTVYAGGRSERIPTSATKDGGIYKSIDAGATWMTIDNGIAIVNGARDMGTVRTVALDPRSCATPPPSGPCPIGSGPLQTVFAAGSGFPGAVAMPYRSARIYKSTNAGASWSASDTGLPLGQYLGMPEDGNIARMGGVNPVVFDPSNTQTIYIGTFISVYAEIPPSISPTIENGVFKSTNGGATWVHSSNGLPRLFGPGSSHRDVLAMAINPASPQTVYAAVVDLYSNPQVGSVYKSNDGGANWSEASTGIAGQDVRALFIDPADATGETIYAGTGGGGANPGGVFRSTNGGASWNSYSLGMPAYSATSLAMPARATGAPARILAGTNAGVWDYTAAADEDADGSPSAIEGNVLGGDGNSDGIPDSQQRGVASLGSPSSAVGHFSETAQGGSAGTTITLMPGTCLQINDASSLQSALYPPDPAGAAGSHDPWGIVSFSLPGCAAATVRVTFHGANFDPNWAWRNYGPRTPGNDDSFGWYTFAGAQRIDATTWELTLDALRQGNYRADPANILFVGGPALLPGRIFDNGFD